MSLDQGLPQEPLRERELPPAFERGQRTPLESSQRRSRGLGQDGVGHQGVRGGKLPLLQDTGHRYTTSATQGYFLGLERR